jgi:hypothetical protein
MKTPRNIANALHGVTHIPHTKTDHAKLRDLEAALKYAQCSYFHGMSTDANHKEQLPDGVSEPAQWQSMHVQPSTAPKSDNATPAASCSSPASISSLLS